MRFEMNYIPYIPQATIALTRGSLLIAIYLHVARHVGHVGWAHRHVSRHAASATRQYFYIECTLEARLPYQYSDKT